MHVLTKIFIVLVALLAVMLVPFVVTYAYNEDSYKAKYESEAAQAAMAKATLQKSDTSHAAELTRLVAEMDQLRNDNRDLQSRVSEKEMEVRQLESRLADAEGMRSEVNARLSTLATSLDAGQKLTDSLVEELRTLRSDALSARRQNVELEEALRDISAQLEVAVEARRALQEQLQALNEEHARSLDSLSEYFALHGPLNEVAAGNRRGSIQPDRFLQATILRVERNSDQVLAEIDAGERDGVREGWVMTIGDGGRFVGNLRIIDVDINRSTGIVEMESATNRRANVGNRVVARPDLD